MKKLLMVLIPTTLFSLMGCQEATENVTMKNNTSLVGQPWNLIELHGQLDTTGDEGKTIFVEFTNEEQRYRGFAGCNNYQGTYTITDSTMTLSQTLATKMMCQQGMQQEDSLFAAFAKTNSYEISGNTLTIFDDAGQTLAVFNAQAQ